MNQKEEEEEKENTTTTTKTTKTRRKKPRILFIGDDEYDSVGGIANEDTDMDALDVSKGLEPLQTTFRRAFFDGLKALNRKRDSGDDEQQHPTSISGAISLALTYANRIERDPSLRGRVKSRLLVVQASEDDAERVRCGMMNCMLCAQSSNIFIDCLCLNEKESSFLQQAAFVSGGIYAKPEKSKGGPVTSREDLLERALCSFLPDRFNRRFLRRQPGSIDFPILLFLPRQPNK